MRLVKKTEYDYDYWTERFELKMASGELKEITVKPLIRRCGYTETFNPEKNPFWHRTPKNLLEIRIERGHVDEGINYSQVESYRSIAKKEFAKKVQHSIYRKWLFFKRHVWELIEGEEDEAV